MGCLQFTDLTPGTPLRVWAQEVNRNTLLVHDVLVAMSADAISSLDPGGICKV
jgi:hypothetical protein